MSIIYDALKKITESNTKNLRIKTDNDSNSKSKLKRKIYLLYILVAGLGFFIANVFFNFFTKPLHTARTPPIQTNLSAENQPSVNISPEETSLKETEAVSIYDQIPKRSISSFVLNGVFFSEDEGYALINNQIVKKGDTVEGATVVQITLDEVELKVDGESIKLSNKNK